jgi:hypothetical protein
VACSDLPLTLVLNSTVTYFATPAALITVGQVAVDQQWYAYLDIENYSDAALSGIRVVLPTKFQLTRLSSVPPVKVQTVPGTVSGGLTRIELSLIEPRNVTRVMMLVASREEAYGVSVTNASERNVAIRTSGQVETRRAIAIRTALQNAIVYAFVVGLIAWFWAKWAEARYVRIGEYQKSIEKAERRIAELEGAVEAARREGVNIAGKMKVLLVSRLNDYSRELSFWRNAIRSLLLSAGAEKKTVEDIFAHVTRSLKTFGTSKTAFEGDNWETIKVAAALVRTDTE